MSAEAVCRSGLDGLRALRFQAPPLRHPRNGSLAGLLCRTPWLHHPRWVPASSLPAAASCQPTAAGHLPRGVLETLPSLYSTNNSHADHAFSPSGVQFAQNSFQGALTWGPRTLLWGQPGLWDAHCELSIPGGLLSRWGKGVEHVVPRPLPQPLALATTPAWPSGRALGRVGGGWLRGPRLDWPGHLQAKIVAVMLFGQSLPIPPQPAVWGPAALCCRSVLGSPLCFRVPCGAWAGPEQGALPPAYLVTWFPPASGAGRAQARARGTESRCTGSPSGARGPRVSPCCCGGPVPPPHTSPL